MAENGEPPPLLSTSEPSKSAAPPLSSRPTITLPSHSFMEALFNSGAGGSGGGGSGLGFSPGPMTLISSLLSDSDDYRSFSQLLTGAMASPAAIPSHHRPSFPAMEDLNPSGGDDFRFKQNRPPGLAINQPPVFTIPPGLSPASFLDSPGLFSPGQ